MPWIIPVVMVVTAVVGAMAAIQQGKAAKAAGDYQAAVQRNNATIAGQNAVIVRDQAAAEAAQVQRENYLRLGSIRASQGKAGGAAGEGSVLDVLGDQAAQGELERQNVIYQGELQARSHLNQQAGDLASANMSQMAGKQAQKASYFRAGTTLLGGASSSYSAYKQIA